MKNIEVVESDSRSALIEYLAGSGENYALLGKNVEAPRRFYSLALHQLGMETRVGIMSSDLGTEPAAIELCNNIALVGHDQFVTAIDLATGALEFDIRLAAPFFHFVTLDECSSVIVVYEIGLVKLSISGKIEWAFEADIIADVAREHDRLIVKRMDNSEPIILSTVSGRVVEGR